MLTILSGFPSNVLAVRASGQVTRRDYEVILIPEAEKLLQHHSRLKFYYELGAEFDGIDAAAAWEDFRFGFEHLARWEKAAIVTDIEWIGLTVKALSFLFPMRIFPVGDEAQARVWISTTDNLHKGTIKNLEKQ